jgi:hypothetical protein
VWVVQVALKRPYTFIVLALLIAIFGCLAALRTPVDIFPNINIPVISVVWTYNGLPANDMSGRVIYYYERTLTSQVGDIDHIESQSLDGYGVVKIFFQKDVNVSSALAQVTAASQTVLKLLPPGITPPYVLSYNASSVPILQLALSSEQLPQGQLFDSGQNFIRPQLATVKGAAVPSPYGGKVLQVQVDLDQQAMQADHVSADDVVDAISAQNLVLPAGTQKMGKFEWNVALDASPTMLDRINDMPVKKVGGTIIYVRDVAYVHQGSPPQTNMVRVNGAKAVLMTILKAGRTSTLNVIDGVKSLLPRIKDNLPPTLHLNAVGDQSVFVKAAVTGVIREGAIAAVLTGLMILLFLGSARSTAIIMIEIPLAILFSLVALSMLGETINVMTLGGLALAVGILVDDGTVTLENINWHLEQGKDITTAIIDGARQIVVPAFVTLVCICIVFVPMFALGGGSPDICSGRWPSPWCSRFSGRSSCRELSCRRWLTICCAATGRRSTSVFRSVSARTPLSVAAILSAGFSTDSSDDSLSCAAGIALCCCSHFIVPRASWPPFWPASSRRSASCRSWARTSFRRSMRGRSCSTFAPRPERASRKRPGYAILSSRAFAARSRPTSSAPSSTTSGFRSAASTWPTATPGRLDPRTPTSSSRSRSITRRPPPMSRSCARCCPKSSPAPPFRFCRPISSPRSSISASRPRSISKWWE